MLRYGQASADEYFVSHDAARQGVKIINNSKFENMVILKHFGPDNPDMPKKFKIHEILDMRHETLNFEL